MNPTIEKVMRGEVVVNDHGSSWKVSSVGTSFLDWMRKNYKDQEDNTWQVWYYSGTMTVIEVTDEKMITMIMLRWE